MFTAAISLLGSQAAQVNMVATQPTYEAWCATFGKCVEFTADEHSLRAAVYADNVKYMDAHNAKYAAGQATFDMGVNEFSAMTHNEFKAFAVGPKIRSRNQTNVQTIAVMTGMTGPADAIDWRTKGVVTNVKNQGACGSCWAFSTTGSTEGRVAIATGSLPGGKDGLSEQQLMDCSQPEGNEGCHGGLMDDAFNYIIKNGGLDSEDNYAYLGQQGEKCNKAKEGKEVAIITGFKDVPTYDEDALTAAVAQGPVSVAIEADQRAFASYKSGILSGICGTKLDHGVLVVGYGDGYWIVKNSWGTTWGDGGYLKIKRSGGKGAGECGIAVDASYPIAGSVNAVATAAAAAAGPYEDPNSGPCADGETEVGLPSVKGTFCSPPCSGNTCPPYPGIAAQAECVIEIRPNNDPTQCALICVPSAADDACPPKASCKPVQGTGICTYDN